MKKTILHSGLIMVLGTLIFVSSSYAQFPGGMGGPPGGSSSGGMGRPEISQEDMEQMRKLMKEKVEEELQDMVSEVLDNDANIQNLLNKQIKEREEKIAAPGSGLGIEFGLYYPSLAAINDRIEALGIKSSGSASPKLEGGFLPGATWRYTLTPELQIGYYGAMADYWCRGDSGTQVAEFGLDFMFNSGLAVYKPKINDQFRPYLGIAIGAVSASYREDSGNSVNKWSGIGVGCLPFFGLQWKPNSLLGLSVDYGYMMATIPSSAMVARGGTLSTAACPDVGLSGSIVKLGIQYHF